MALSSEQLTNARTILRVGQRLGAGPKALKAALEAGLVESNLSNLRTAVDHDSLGVFQQRPSMGWGSPSQVTNPEYAATQFFKRAIPIAGKYGSAGQLAQAVQRSAFPERYDQRSSMAAQIMRQHKGQPELAQGMNAQGPNLASSLPQPAPGLSELLKPPAPQGPPITVPDAPLSGRQYLPLPKNFQTVSSPAPEPQPSIDDSLSAISQLQPSQLQPQQEPSSAPLTPSEGPSRGRGRVTVAKGANRAGVGLSKPILDFAEKVSAVRGRPLSIGTGSNHSRLTANGNVSNHWDGNAFDAPASGQELTRQGQAALVAAGMPSAQARKAKGGIYNVGGYQVIFNAPDHFDHLHAGYRGR